MLPNLFPDHGAKPEYNSVDASLWYIIAVHELLAACQGNGGIVTAKGKRAFQDAILAILNGYSGGTRFGIRMDSDGLLAAGERGVQLTWMDAKVGEWVVTPRAGKPVEIQALWLNALKIAAQFSPNWKEHFERGLKSFRDKFWNEKAGCLYDVIDVNGCRLSSKSNLRCGRIAVSVARRRPSEKGCSAGRRKIAYTARPAVARAR
jgi:predicted glycogen debranching enzyme